MAEQRYQAVLAVIGEGSTVTEVARRWGVSRQSLHTWLARYEAGGLEGLADRSHRPVSCPHQMEPDAEAVVLEMRRVRWDSASCHCNQPLRCQFGNGRSPRPAAV